MPRILEITLAAAALCLAASSFASAQECESDTDCAEGERCESGLVLACDEPPCDQPPGQCVNALIGEACVEDADCGPDLTCARLLVEVNCAEGEPDCTPEAVEDEGFCADNATLAASSGLAPDQPMIATASGAGDEGAGENAVDGAAGGAAPVVMESNTAPLGDGDQGASSGGDSSSGCTVGGETGGIVGLLPLALSLLGVGLRRRRRAA